MRNMAGETVKYSTSTLTVFIVAILISASMPAPHAEENNSTLVFSYQFTSPTVVNISVDGQTYLRIQLGDLPLYGGSGKPRLPVKPLRILLPPSTIVRDLHVETSELKTFEIQTLTHLEMGTHTFPLNQKPDVFPQGFSETYNDSDVYPETLYNNLGVQYFRGYPVLHVNLHPVHHIVGTNTFFYYDQMTLTIETQPAESNPLYRGLEQDKTGLLRIIDNPEMLNNYPTVSESGSQYEYLLITTEQLLNAQGEYTFYHLLNHRESQGLSCISKTVEDIENEYDGVDTAEKIRNFIKDAYQNWGTTWVLLGGDVEQVPIRYLHDFDGEDVVVSSDLYYQCLDGTYNYDGDTLWGEKNDGEDGGRVDLYAEVYIGRAPVDDEQDVSAFVEKTLTYENSHWEDDGYLRRHLSVGEQTWDGPGGWGAGYVERCIDHCTDYNQETFGIPSHQYTIVPLYERDMEWTRSDLIDEINTGVNIINHVGHGTYKAAMKLLNTDVNILSNTGKYNLFYSQACHSGQVEKQDCIAETWVTAEKTGGFATIMNTGVGYGGSISYDGPDNRYAREFFDALFSAEEKITHLGEANQDSKQDNFYRIDESGMHMYHVYYDTQLYGDPYVEIKGSEGTMADFTWDPDYPKTGQAVAFTDHSTGNIIYREWDFGDGGYSQEKDPHHAYAREDVYTVTLTIMDDVGYMTSISYDVEVRDKWDPIPVVYYGYNGENEYTIDFYGNDSYDPDGSITGFLWDFDDGNTSTDVSPTHEFPAMGTYNVRFTVTDDEGNTGVTFIEITIAHHQPPMKPTITGPNGGIAEIAYAFKVNTSDPEGYIIRYGWDWGDGTPVEWTSYIPSGETLVVTHTWDQPGNYTVRVVAKNLPGVESSWSDPFYVEIVENDDPIVEILKPAGGFYLNNNRILPFFTPIVVGAIDVEITAVDGGGVARVELYIDGELKANMTSSPYVWHWDEQSFLRIHHTIEAVAYDTTGRTANTVTTVWKFF